MSRLQAAAIDAQKNALLEQKRLVRDLMLQKLTSHGELYAFMHHHGHNLDHLVGPSDDLTYRIMKVYEVARARGWGGASGLEGLQNLHQDVKDYVVPDQCCATCGR